MAQYVNQSHKPKEPHYGPENYTTDAEPQEYRGFLIYHRLAEVWDVVKDDVCVGQFAGPNGARSDIDHYLDGTGISYLRIPEAEVPSGPTFGR